MKVIWVQWHLLEHTVLFYTAIVHTFFIKRLILEIGKYIRMSGTECEEKLRFLHENVKSNFLHGFRKTQDIFASFASDKSK